MKTKTEGIAKNKVSIYNILKGYFTGRSVFLSTFSVDKNAFNQCMKELFDSSFSHHKPKKINEELLQAEQKLVDEGILKTGNDSSLLSFSKQKAAPFKPANITEQEIVSLALLSINEVSFDHADNTSEFFSEPTQETKIRDFLIECGLEAN